MLVGMAGPWQLLANSVEKLILKLSVLWVCHMQISFSIQ